ncbi:metallophosphoesterase [Oleidesulfovibrio sp.]|uniref:metallophosphoesterase n=1 Tax=Oleidesulfovibrio sp. TaxID=2909707 RepID=UPI003A8BC2BC
MMHIEISRAYIEAATGRLKPELWHKRIQLQKKQAQYKYELTFTHPEESQLFARAVLRGLKMFGLLERARAEAHDITIKEHTVVLQILPKQFDGLRILHLSDLHLDGFADNCEALLKAVSGLSADACIITGDFRFGTSGPADTALSHLQKLMQVIRCRLGTLAVLGNHDWLEHVPAIESTGIRVLLNEAVLWVLDGAALRVAGIDDPHFFGTQDIPAALQDAPPSAATILLAHSPEAFRQAAATGVHVYLCGHTHGGQSCLPGGIPVMTNCHCPRALVRGAWSFKGMQGYTSKGTGSSSVQARLFCRPEIVIHTLRAMKTF